MGVAPVVAVMRPEVPPVALTTSLSVEIPPELRARPRVTPIVTEEKAAKRAPRTVGDDTLEKVVASVYASLLVELRAGGERGSVLARYPVEGEPGLERLVASWEERLARGPALRKEVEEAMKIWAGYLRKARGTGWVMGGSRGRTRRRDGGAGSC